jgi:hypothetical protein
MMATKVLTLIKIAHTLIWAVMAVAIIAISLAAMRGRFRVAAWLSVLILAECIVLAVNGGRCPLTDLAARYTADRAAKFDIYLPQWVAERNKMIFGGLFVAGELVWLWRWMAHRAKR